MAAAARVHAARGTLGWLGPPSASCARLPPRPALGALAPPPSRPRPARRAPGCWRVTPGRPALSRRRWRRAREIPGIKAGPRRGRRRARDPGVGRLARRGPAHTRAPARRGVLRCVFVPFCPSRPCTRPRRVGTTRSLSAAWNKGRRI